MNYLSPSVLERIAASYVLGTLSPRARRRFNKVLPLSPQAQRAVALWQEMLAPLHASIVPVAPPASVWRAIDRRVRPPVRASAPFWRRWLQPVLALALGAVLAVGTVQQRPGLVDLQEIPAELAPSYVGILSDAAGAPVLATSALRYSRNLNVKVLRPLVVPEGKVALLWALPDGAAPVLIGQVPGTGKAVIVLPALADLAFAKISKLGVSLEASATVSHPQAGFALTGSCAKIW